MIVHSVASVTLHVSRLQRFLNLEPLGTPDVIIGLMF